MEQLPALKRTLKERLPTEGISYVIRTLKEYLPQESPKYNAVLQLESEYRDVKMKIISGVIDDEANQRYHAQLRKRLLDLIDGLEPEDFDKNTRRSKVAKEQKIRTGSVLYQIPKKMQLGEESRCLVRIAFDKAMLIEDIDLDENTEFRGDVRLSDYMQVQLIDPKRGAAFTIESTSKAVQLVDEDDFTEWRFYVTPLQAGRHLLELKVCIMYVIDGREVLREKTLEESVVIVSEPVVEPAAAEFSQLPGQLVLAEPIDLVAPQSSLPAWLRGRGIALGLSLLLLFSATTTYAFVPELPAYLDARYIERDPTALRAFEAAYPDSPLADNALWGAARIVDEPEAYLDYQERYPATEKAQRVPAIVEALEAKVWREVQSQTTAPLIGRYLALYGERGRHRAEAVELLRDTAVWQAPPPQNLDRSVAGRLDSVYKDLQRVVEKEITDPRIQQIARQKIPPSTSPNPTTNTQVTTEVKVDSVAIGEQSQTPATTPPNSPKTSAAAQRVVPPTGGTTGGPPPESPKPSATAQSPVPLERGTTGGAPPRPAQVTDETQSVDNPATETPPEVPPGTSTTDPVLRTDSPANPDPAVGSEDVDAILAQIDAAMVRIAGDEFTMGCQDGRDTDCYGDESPAHTVRVPTFELSKFEVTQVQWRAVMGVDPEELHNTGCDACPVEGVSWNDAQAFIQKLNNLTGDNYRLPTEAEWEFAARGGQRSRGFLYSGSNDVDAVAWYSDNYADGNTSGSKQTTRPVGRKASNELGLYDMSGNVREWCADDWHSDYENAPTDGSAWVDSPRGSNRVYRGGSWVNDARYCRAASRNSYGPTYRSGYVGFRLARS